MEFADPNGKLVAKLYIARKRTHIFSQFLLGKRTFKTRLEYLCYESLKTIKLKILTASSVT